MKRTLEICIRLVVQTDDPNDVKCAVVDALDQGTIQGEIADFAQDDSLEFVEASAEFAP